MHRVELQPGVRQPLAQLAHGGSVTVVEVRPCGEDLHGLEPVRRDIHQVLADEPAVVEEMRGNSEAAIVQSILCRQAN